CRRHCYRPALRSPLVTEVLQGALIMIWVIPFLLLLSTPAFAACSNESVTPEALPPSDKYFIIEGDQLDRFITNANDLYNIGWVRADIAKVYVIDAEYKAENPKFQPVHLFFIDNAGCIQYYQAQYRAVVDLLLSPQPCKVLGIACGD